MLLSGGIDSPVAGFVMGKRGMEIGAIHFHSYPFTSERGEEKAVSYTHLNEAKTLKYKTVLGTDETEKGKFALKTKTLETIQGKEITVPAKGSVDVKITVDASKFDACLLYTSRCV